MNDYTSFRADLMPYGGVILSGIGREVPKYLIDEFMEMKLVVVHQHHSVA